MDNQLCLKRKHLIDYHVKEIDYAHNQLEWLLQYSMDAYSYIIYKCEELTNILQI